MDMKKRIGRYEISETKSGKVWARSLPYSTDLKEFKSLDNAVKYAKKKQKRR